MDPDANADAAALDQSFQNDLSDLDQAAATDADQQISHTEIQEKIARANNQLMDPLRQSTGALMARFNTVVQNCTNILNARQAKLVAADTVINNVRAANPGVAVDATAGELSNELDRRLRDERRRLGELEEDFDADACNLVLDAIDALATTMDSLPCDGMDVGGAGTATEKSVASTRRMAQAAIDIHNVVKGIDVDAARDVLGKITQGKRRCQDLRDTIAELEQAVRDKNAAEQDIRIFTNTRNKATRRCTEVQDRLNLCEQLLAQKVQEWRALAPAP